MQVYPKMGMHWEILQNIAQIVVQLVQKGQKHEKNRFCSVKSMFLNETCYQLCSEHSAHIAHSAHSPTILLISVKINKMAFCTKSIVFF